MAGGISFGGCRCRFDPGKSGIQHPTLSSQTLKALQFLAQALKIAPVFISGNRGECGAGGSVESGVRS
ncbi:hypothetical protein AXA56_04050 [Escherichia coli]|nr:hypothetical protein AXA56_04050 [Escherichia coli]